MAEAKQEETLAVITGANRGIGLEFVKQLLQRDGYSVVALCRNPEKATDLKALQETHKNRLSVEKLELTKDEDIENVVKSLKDKPIDLLILNAGIIGEQVVAEQGAKTSGHQYRLRRLGNLTRDDMINVFNVNVVGPMLLAQGLFDNVKASSRKQIVGISSGMGSIADCGSNTAVPYRASKAAMNMSFQAFFQESKAEKLGVHAITMNPGWVQTDLGGTDATKTVTESVQQMLTVIDNKEKLNNGGFYNYNGKVYPW